MWSNCLFLHKQQPNDRCRCLTEVNVIPRVDWGLFDIHLNDESIRPSTIDDAINGVTDLYRNIGREE